MRRAFAFLSVPLLLAASVVYTEPAMSFDLDTGNAPIEIIIPAVAPIIFTDVSPSGSDATLVLRVTALVTNAWFDASAPYHATAQGVYSRLGRRPPSEAATNRNINIACLYASYRVLNSVLPKRMPEWRAMLVSVGLDPDNVGENTTTPVGIGNLAGKAIVTFREHDGMNQLGDAGGRVYNREPYADYTGYAPVNSAEVLRDPSRWQPRIVPLGSGIFRIQKFVTPQYRLVKPYSFTTPNRFNTPKPTASDPHGTKGRAAYQKQVEEVLSASAALTDYQKMVAELFNNKITGLGFSIVFGVAIPRGLSVLDFIHIDFLTNLAAFDTGIAVWNEKAKWDAVRPFSAVRHVYGDRPVRAWGGPGKGTVDDIPASHWKEYLNVADHPEYPSGSSAFCAAHAQAARRFLGDDTLNWAVPAPMGSSTVEPGITPATDIVLGPWTTWTEWEEECGLSRLWGGVHFSDAIAAGKPIGREIGELAYQFVKRHIDGNAPPLP